MYELEGLPAAVPFNSPGDISTDGSTIVGVSNGLAVKWIDGIVEKLGDLPGGLENGGASAVSADGSIIVGRSWSDRGIEAFYWTEATGITEIGFLDGGNRSDAFAVSIDGKIVGRSNSISGTKQYIWTVDTGMRELTEYLISQGVEFDGWDLDPYSSFISDDGTTFVGTGINPNGQLEGWIARIEPITVDEPSILLLLCSGLAVVWRRPFANKDMTTLHQNRQDLL